MLEHSNSFVILIEEALTFVNTVSCCIVLAAIVTRVAHVTNVTAARPVTLSFPEEKPAARFWF